MFEEVVEKVACHGMVRKMCTKVCQCSETSRHRRIPASNLGLFRKLNVDSRNDHIRDSLAQSLVPKLGVVVGYQELFAGKAGLVRRRLLVQDDPG